MAVLLNDFYSETIQVTRKIRSLVVSLDEGEDVPNLEIFQINPDFNKKIELYVLSVTAKYKIEKPYLAWMKQYQTVKHIREDSYCTFKLKKPEENDILLTDSGYDYDTRLNTVQETSTTTPMSPGMRINTNTDDLDIIIQSKTVLSVKDPGSDEQPDLLYQSEKIGTYSRRAEKEKKISFIMKLPKTRNPKIRTISASNPSSIGMNSSFSNTLSVQSSNSSGNSNECSNADL